MNMNSDASYNTVLKDDYLVQSIYFIKQSGKAANKLVAQLAPT